MKKILFILALLLCFTACSGQQSVNSDVSSDTAIENEEKQETIYTDSNLYDTVGAYDFTMNLQAEKQVDNYLAGNVNVLKGVLPDTLKKKGFSIKTDKVTKLDNTNVSFTVILTDSSGNSLQLDMGARMKYSYRPQSSDGRYADIANLRLSTDRITDLGQEIALIRHNNPQYGDILFFDAETLKPIDKNIDLSVIKDYAVADICKVTGGYIIAYGTNKENGFAFADENGNITLNTFDAREENFLNVAYNDWGFSYIETMDFAPDNSRKLRILDENEDIAFMSFGKDSEGEYGIAYSFKENRSYMLHHRINIENGNHRFDVYKRINYNGENGEIGNLLVQRTFKGQPQTTMILSDKTANCFQGYENTHMPYHATNNMNQVTILNEGYGETAVFDFENKSLKVSYSPTEKHIEREFAATADGRYSLYEGGFYGGGDVSYGMIVLKDNRTNQLKYIDTIGGMYGGSESAGFFSNGDIYTIGLDEFKIFTTDMSRQGPIFEMSKNFPLGTVKEGNTHYRDLLAVRRNPDDHSFVVLYTDREYYEKYEDSLMPELGGNFFKSTYKIGILDPQGELTKFYDTGEYVMTYSFRTVEMYMAQDNVIRFSVLFKGYDPQLEGEINLTTGEYINISGGYNS